MELFATRGFAQTSVDHILKEADCQPGSFYHAFPSKESLLLAVLDAYHSGIDEMLLKPAWLGIDDPLERVFALLARYRMLILATDCEYGCPIGSLARVMHMARKPVRERIAANFSAWTNAVHGCFLEAAERFEPNTNLRDLAEFTLTTMEGAVMQTRTFKDIAYFDRSVQQLRNYVQSLLLPTVRPPKAKKQLGH